jgi:hypothetical protein
MGKVKRVLKWVGAVLGVVIAGVGAFVYVCCSKFDASMDKVYAVPPSGITHSTDAAVIARGDHLAHSIAGCALKNCHGNDLGGGETLAMGPLGTFTGPNITPDAVGAAYSDGELGRLIKHGIKRDGRSVRFMPAQDIAWLPDTDVAAIVSYVRSVKPGDGPNGVTTVGTLGKVLDRQEKFVWDVARHIDHTKTESVPAPAPTAAYGAFVSRLCTGCHGEHLSGGPIPGAPSSFAIPLNLTPDATGLKDWAFADFEKTMKTGIRKNGKPLDSLMPVEGWKNFDDDEMHAVWEYLRSLPATPFGQR